MPMGSPPEVLPRKFRVELIKPSHYDDQGYVIQWRRSAIPSNSLACLYALTREVAERRALGPDVEVLIEANDETNVVIDVAAVTRRIREAGAGVVCLVGVQSNQFPRAAHLARQFREGGIPVAMGGFHVSGCLAMLPEIPPEIRDLQELGVSLFAGEAEGRLESVLRDALLGTLKPLYDHMDDLPSLGGQVTPFLTRGVAGRYLANFTSFDAGRGCPFKCSFCTIINVQGRTSRWREADDVEKIVRANLAQGVYRYFITDDNFARNRNWEAVFDRIAALRKSEDPRISLTIQVDTMCHKIPGFIDKAKAAGTRRVFIGLENINPDNLVSAHKNQNRIGEYRRMIQEWRRHGVITYAGYILGFPGDTPESIVHDIEVIKRELPIDILEFFILTPLPGSADHQALHAKGAWMDPDLNKYDLEHVTSRHKVMSSAQLEAVYHAAWHQYYTPEHVETLMRRAEVMGPKAQKIELMVFQFYGSYRYEKLHPLQSGLFRRKVRTSRRPGLPLESPFVFYPRRAVEFVSAYVRLGLYFLKLHRIRRRVERDPARLAYTDVALTPPSKEADAELEMLKPVSEERAATRLRSAEARAS
jgi:Radical SAM superfamily